VPIDPNSPKSLSAQVKDDLVHRIVAGRYRMGEKIPSLRALAEEYGVAELTVHAAVKALQYEGVLESTSGRGTFVRAVPADAKPAELATTVAELQAEVADLRERVAAIEEAQRQAEPRR
jgi:DNA-binding GntR family transcriptional regulator